MEVKFHEPADRRLYASKVLEIFLQTALTEARRQMDAALRAEPPEPGEHSG